MNDEIVYVLDVDRGDDITTTAVVCASEGGRDILAAWCGWNVSAGMFDALKDAITAHGVPDMVVMDAGAAWTDTVAEYCLRMGIQVRWGCSATSMSVVERALHRFAKARP